MAVKTHIAAHLRALCYSLGQLLRAPFSSLLTIAVIAVALALPLNFYVILQNAHQLSGNWNNNSTQISLYLKHDLPAARTQDLLRQIKANPQIAAVNYISAKQGLEQFANALQAKQAISALKTNPLPDVIIVHPTLSLRSALAISQLKYSLQKLPEVKTAQLNMQWLQRLNNILDLARRAVLAIAFLLGIGILLIIGNTIRLATQNERREISVLQLVGATKAFIRRPFLYIGLWYGLFGGLLAWLIVNIVIWFLQAPISKLALSYNSLFALSGLTFATGIKITIISIILGIAGSWLSLSRNLSV